MKRPTLRTWRRAVQIGVALAFVLIPWLNALHISVAYGNFLAFKLAGFPLADPLAVLQITLKNGYLSRDLLIGAGVALGLTVILGTVFCSWICPYGLLSEWTFALGERIGRRRRKAAGEGRSGFRIKCGLFIAGLFGFLILSTTPVLNQLSLPAWYSRIFQFIFIQSYLSMAVGFIGVVLLVELLARRRLWCRYVCPQSVLIGLAKNANPRRMNVRFEKERCICRGRVDPCRRACTLGLSPKSLNRSPETECTNCGDCVVACKRRGRALRFGFG